MSKVIWYLTYPINALLVWERCITTYRTGGKDYWWGIAKDVHEEKWGKL